MIKTSCSAAVALLCISTSVFGLDSSCAGLPGHAQLQNALQSAREAEIDVLGVENGASILNMWVSIVNRDGFVCAVAFSGADRNSQWPGSRLVSAQKAYTANAFSLDGLALSTANLYAAAQPGGSLYALEDSNPVAANLAYAGDSRLYGTAKDPLAGKKVGGIIVFGGGLGLYANGKIIGAIGVSGDSSCADHNIAWRTRAQLDLDALQAGVNDLLGSKKGDNIIFDIKDGVSASGFGHPTCDTDPNKPSSQTINNALFGDSPESGDENPGTF